MKSAFSSDRGPETRKVDSLPETVVLELQYLPCLEYIACLLKYDRVCIEAQEHYQKQTYRNRCYIRTAGRVMMLSVPVLEGNRKIPIRDVRVDYRQSWLKDHWRAIASAYGKAPFFEHYAPFFEPILFRKPAYLFDLNWELLTKCLALLRIQKSLIPTSSYVKSPESPRLDLRSVIHPKKNYQNNKIYNGIAYVQNFGNTFVPNLSVVDLLFCEGTRARSILEQSINW
ncbi:MAG: WbqC family protein [Ferruginibacter sp.]|nr:WbqC family protein [Cytophagales bacterium]